MSTALVDSGKIDDGEDTKIDGTTPSNVSLMDVSILEKYLLKAVPLILDFEDNEVAEFEKALKNVETQLILKKYISNSQSPVLLIQKLKGRICL